MIPLTIKNIPNILLEIIGSRAEMIMPSSKIALLHFQSMPLVSLGTDIEITSLDTYQLHSNADDELLTDEFTLYDFDDNGTVYYKAKSNELTKDIIC